MISNPKVGQLVQCWYSTKKRKDKKPIPVSPLHGKVGYVKVVGTGKPRNHVVNLLGIGAVVVPCGNLRVYKDE